MPAFLAGDGMPVRVDLLTTAARRSERFYRDLLGWSFADAGEGRRMATLQGMPISALFAAAGTDRWRVCFHVEDVPAVAGRARELGAEVALEPTELADGSVMAVVADPFGALVGLLRQPGERAFFAAGEPGAPVWFELVTGAGVDEAAEFYHELLGWEISVAHRADGGVGYAVAMADGAAFAGIAADGLGAEADPADAAGAGRWSGWLAYLGVADIDAAVARTGELGGQVAVPPQATEFGPLATIVDPAGATTVLCEVPPPPEEDIRESDPLEGFDISPFE